MGMSHIYKKLFSFNDHERDQWVTQQAVLIPAGWKVLDVGAGSCPYQRLFSHCEYRSHDFVAVTPEQLRGKRGYGNIDYISDITTIPVASESFDVILCTEVLEHVSEPIKAVNEFRRILRPGGTLLLTAPLGSGLHQEPYHFYGGYTPYWFHRFLNEAGFKDILVEPNGGFFKHYGQESRRFSVMLNPKYRNKTTGYLLSPLWLVTLPWFYFLMPLLCHYLDYLDKNKAFTVGYFVRAIKR
jgi:ubiquinone/menaquinone biosynthesis C-methylase UbiE